MNRLARWLLRLFPRAFRDAFESELLGLIETDQDRARADGRLRSLQVGLGAAIDLVRSGLAERWRPTWPGGLAGAHPMGRGGMMTGWWSDLRLAARALARAPGFTAVTVLTLGVAIGAHAGIFSVVDAVLLRPLPFHEPDRLVHIAASAPGSDFPDEFGPSVEFLLQYRDEATHLESVAAYNWFTATLRTQDRVERIPMSWPTLSLFETLGATPILGRLPTPEEEDRVVVISHALWTTWFGQDPGVIGQSYEFIGNSRTVVGVMGPGFHFPNDRVLVWIPRPPIRAEDVTPGRFGGSMLARVAPDVSLEEVTAQLNAVARRLPERFGGTPAYARIIEQHRAVVRPLRVELLGSVSGPLWVLMGSVTLVLLIACANIANLLLVRAERRQRDMAVRQAMGAARGQLVRGQLAEAALIAVVGGALGILVAWLGAPLLIQAAPDDIPRADQVGLDLTTVGFVLATSAFAAVACGLFPALRASTTSLSTLREAGRGATRRWGSNGLVVAQTALALVLLVGSGLLVRSFQALRAVDPGYDIRDIYSFQIAPEEEHLNDGPSFARFHVDFMARLAALPGVESVGLVENLPLNEGLRSDRFRRENDSDDEDEGPFLQFTFAGGDYFPTMGIALLRGRAFQADDHALEVGNVILSEAAADLLWPGQDPIGRRLRQSGDDQPWETVIGVVENVHQYTFRETSDPMLYRPMMGPTPEAWVLSSPAYVVRTARADRIGSEIRELVREVAPSAPMYRTYTMEGLAADSMDSLSFIMLTLGVAAGLALLLGALGLYGVLSYVVTQRTQEIGVRMTLGARAREVQRMVVGQGVRVVLLGVGLGVGLAALVTRALGALLFGVEALDVATFVAMSGMMVAIGVLASYLPARRASSVDPVEALRME